MAISGTRQNLLLDVQGSNEDAQPGGTPIQRVITIRNCGVVEAAIDLWITPRDAKSELLRRWCTFSEPNPLQVAAGERREVVLEFNVPLQAEAGFYSYDICARAPQYSEEMVERTQQLRVLSSEQSAEFRNEPSFALEPPTSSEKPYDLQAEATLTVKVKVQNGLSGRVGRTDRFFLKCPELDLLSSKSGSAWYEIEYPESSPAKTGVATRTEGLRLNPGESGEISLLLKPPIYTQAGNYSSTVRLLSENQRDSLVLLDIIYLNILIDDRLITNLEPPSCKIPSATKTFNLSVRNPGNISRYLTIQARDEDGIFTYIPYPNQLQLAPGEAIDNLTLTPKPKKRWRRSWRGQGQTIDFTVAFDNVWGEEAVQAATTPISTPALPENLVGKILWLPRPSLVRWLLIAALILLLLSVTTLAVRWLIEQLVVRPSLEPKLLEFSATEKAYQASTGNPIRLDFQINNADTLKKVEIAFYPQDGTKPSQPVTYYHDQDKDHIQLTQQPGCQEEPRQPGPILQMLYQLYLPKEKRETKMITCRGVLVQPTIDNRFEFNPGNYAAELKTYASNASEEDILKPTTAQDKGQSPQQVQSKGKGEGEGEGIFSHFKLDAFFKRSSDKNLQVRNAPERLVDSRKVKDIQVKSPPAPEVLYFYSKAPIYRQLDAESSSETGGSEANPRYPRSPVQLNWIISNPLQIQQLELTALYVTTNGVIRNSQLRYEVKDGKPSALGQKCRVEAQQLICENIPTLAQIAGKYTFTLKVVWKNGQKLEQLFKNTEGVEVRPPLPQIQSFTINGQDAQQNPQQVFSVNPARRDPVEVLVEWKVKDPTRMTVELLPAPGALAPGTDNMSYALSPSAGVTTLTLQVTNQVGEKVNRTVVIKTVESNPLNPSGQPAGVVPVPPPPPNAPVPGIPTNPGELPPFEAPPRPN